jgi:hypothetical protein
MTDEPTVSDAVRDHVRRVLQASRAYDDALEAKATELERAGHRIINCDQADHDAWDVTDWRTGETIAEGDGHIEGYDRAADQLDPDDKWFHIDQVAKGIPNDCAPAIGIPQSLGEAIESWAESTSTTDEDIAEVAGWSVQTVREYR